MERDSYRLVLDHRDQREIREDRATDRALLIPKLKRSEACCSFGDACAPLDVVASIR